MSESLRKLTIGTSRMLAASLGTIAIAGCAMDAPAPRLKLPTAAARLYQAPPDRVLTSTLLDFEGPHDAAFIDSPAVRLGVDPQRPTSHVLVADGGTRINLASLVRGRDYGGTWDMVGVRLWSATPMTCELSLRQSSGAARSTRVAIAGGVWVNVWIDVAINRAATRPAATTLSGTTSPDMVQLTVSPGASNARLLIDDVVMAQSRVTVSESHVPRWGERWTVGRVGPQWRAMLNGQTIFELPAAPFAADGYRVSEGGPTRAVFVNEAGSTIAIDRTGRLIQDGVAKLDQRVLKVAKAIAENASPAKVEVVGDEGRLERSLPGDRDNDGYDEQRGCYTVHAVAGRAAVRFTRQGATVKWPVLEVLDLPAGAISVFLDGELIPWAVRGDDGRAIVELPIELQTPVEVQVRVK